MKISSLFLALIALLSLVRAQTPAAQATKAVAQWQKMQRQLNLAQKPATASKQLDSVHVSFWEVDDWVMDTRILHTNNANQQVIAALTLLQDSLGTAWYKSDSIGYTYTAFDSIATEEGYLWDIATQTWRPDYQNRYVYSPSHKRDSLIGYTWNDTAWVLSSTEVNTWTAFDSLEENVAVYLDENGAIAGGARIANRYNAANNIDSTLTENWDVTADDWMPSMLDVYHYNNQGLADTIYSYQPDTTQTAWELAAASVITYDANGRPVTLVSQTDLGNGLEDFLRVSLSYTAAGLPASQSFEINFLGTWLTLNETTYTYDADNHLVDEVTAGTDIFSGNFLLENQTRIQSYWNGLGTGNAANMAAQLRILVANPAKAGSAIHFSGISGAATLTISDLQGKVLASRQLSDAETTLPMTLRTGLYLIQVQTGNAPAVTEKILILE